MTRYYLHAAEGDCLYAIIVSGWNVTVPGSVRNWHTGKADQRGHLVRADGPVERIAITRPTYEALDRYDLADADLASVALPAQLTAAEWAALPENRQEMYVRATVRGENTEYIDVSDHVPITMTEAAPDKLPTNWKPSAWADIYGPALAHQVPGVLTNYRQALTRLGKEYGDCYDHEASGTKPIEVSVRSYWSPPRTTMQGKGRMRQTRETWMTHNVKIDGPEFIAGNTLAEAQQRWDAGMFAARALLAEYTTARTCGHCDGRGFIPGDAA